MDISSQANVFDPWKNSQGVAHAPARRTADITIIIPVHNDPENLARCVDAIRRSYRTAKILVVDDASTDATAAVAADAGVQVLKLNRRAGPAAARNRGAAAVSSGVLFFVDADVLLHADAVGRVEAQLCPGGNVDAVFGSYDSQPGCPNFCSQYKNLFHRHVHQTASREASTFWSGCGAIRREIFLRHGGFSDAYDRPCVEDIELGMRLRKAGHRIVIDRQLLATHLKEYSIRKISRSDVFDRAIPWAKLIVTQPSTPNDLNLRRTQRASAALACIATALTSGGAVQFPSLILLPILSLTCVWLADKWSKRTKSLAVCAPVVALFMTMFIAAILHGCGSFGVGIAVTLSLLLLLNYRFYADCIRLRGCAFAALVVPMHVLYFVYSSASIAFVAIQHTLRPRRRTPNPAIAAKVSRA